MSERKQLDSLGISAFCESMGMMAKAGIQTDEAIHLLKQGEHQTGLLGESLQEMAKTVEEGNNLSYAMKQTGIFPEYALQMIEAGESTRKLEDVLFHLSSYYADQKTLSDKIHSAITYPSAMLVMIIAVLAIMLWMVLPAFTDVYKNLTGSLSASSYSYINLAYTFCRIALVIMVILAVIMVGGLWMWNHGKRETVENILWKIPVCASILESLGMFRFTSALEMFLASGKMQDDAVLDSIAMTDCKPVEEKLKKCSRRMEEGIGFAQAAYDEELFEPIYGRMLLPGERSGNMESVLQRLTGLLKDNCMNLTEHLVNIVEPLLSGVLMVTIGLTLLSVMLPLIGMMNSIG